MLHFSAKHPKEAPPYSVCKSLVITLNTTHDLPSSFAHSELTTLASSLFNKCTHPAPASGPSYSSFSFPGALFTYGSPRLVLLFNICPDATTSVSLFFQDLFKLAVLKNKPIKNKLTSLWLLLFLFHILFLSLYLDLTQ